MHIAIITPLIGVVGVLFGAWIGGVISQKASKEAVESSNQNAINVMRSQEQIQRVASFRAAFAPTLSFLYITQEHGTHDKPDIDTHIKEALLSHGAAIEMFRPFVPKHYRREYQQAWENYRKAVAMDQYDLSAEAIIEGVSSEEFLKIKIHSILL